ncbi:MAG TPA: hypothetical protein VFL67_10290 [Mycobacterium sp.]|nr:hypothetical protein [Mycobacterium sp.]
MDHEPVPDRHPLGRELLSEGLEDGPALAGSVFVADQQRRLGGLPAHMSHESFRDLPDALWGGQVDPLGEVDLVVA